jgi:glucose/arabinose dehydrogenase
MAGYKSLLVLQSILFASFDVGLVRAQSSSSSASASATACASTIAPQHAAPSVAAGWRAEVVASGLSNPRGILFDTEGALLMVEQGKGVSRVRFNEESGSCIRMDGEKEVVIDDKNVSLASFDLELNIPCTFAFSVHCKLWITHGRGAGYAENVRP